MHLHILGICGTFMGGVAVLAREAGHQVSGSDQNVFPPMSTQLKSLGIPLHQGYDAGGLSPKPDSVVVGNVMSRGSPVVEHMLDESISYTSGPQWLAEHVLHDRHVLAVAGTHGKTTTASMLAWILECAGLKPGFLIGGVPVDFGVSARLGGSKYFVVEADEYDTAFFDKRSKFVHYKPRTLILTNIEYDHADIFPDMDAIRRQFHHLIRTVPGRGRIIAHADSDEIKRVLAMGCWTLVESYGADDSDWSVGARPDSGSITVGRRANRESVIDTFAWPGVHNRHNALAACAAASHVGVPLQKSVAALACWRGVRRRLEQVASVGGITVYDDFAHHPTEIAATLLALRGRIGAKGRLIAVFEPRSNSMKLGTHASALGAALTDADLCFLYQPADLRWDLEKATASAKSVRIESDIDLLCQAVIQPLRDGDSVVVMSNGAFGGMAQRLAAALRPVAPD